jgi:acyl carrier protein
MPRSELAAMLLELLQQETGETFERLTDETDLREELKLDSVDMVSLLLHVENALHLNIDTQELGNLETVGQLLDLLENKLAPVSAATKLAA